MAAYILAQIRVNDPDGYEQYRAKVPEVVARHGGRYLVRGGAPEALEGTAMPRMVILEFADRAAAKQFYQSPDYQEILPLRLAAAEGTAAIIDGV